MHGSRTSSWTSRLPPQAALADRSGTSRRWLITVESGHGGRAELGKILDTLDALGITLTATTDRGPDLDLLEGL